MNTYEEQKAIVAKFNVIDDVFFQKMVDDIEVAEEMLRIILRKPKLKVIKCQTQRFLRNTGAHSVVLDFVRTRTIPLSTLRCRRRMMTTIRKGCVSTFPILIRYLQRKGLNMKSYQ